MSISDPYTAVKALLQGNATLTAMLGVYSGTSIPMISGGEIPEVELNMPAIEYELEPSFTDLGIGTYNFLLNIYTEKAREGALIALTVLNEFHQKQTPVNGYFTQTTCNILTSVVDPTSRQVNTPMEFRIVNI